MNLDKKFKIIIQLYTLILLFMGLIHLLACEEKPDATTRNMPLESMPVFENAPTLEITRLHTQSNMSAKQKTETRQAIHALLDTLVKMVHNKNFSKLPEYLDKEAGLWVDLKAHRTYDQVVKEVVNPDSYLNVYFLDSVRLQARTGDIDKLAVRDVLHRTQIIKVQIHEEGDGEFEMQLHLSDAPGYNYYLNNPVFLKKGNRWFIYRMF